MGRVGALRIAGGLGYAPGTPPVDPPPPPATDIYGYAGTFGVTGGTGGATSNPTTWAQFRTALSASRPRTIILDGSTPRLDGGGDDFTVTGDDLTIDATGWPYALRNYTWTFRGSNLIFRELRMRPGDEAGPGNVNDWAPIKFNPGNGAGDLSQGILLDKCSLMWGPDVILGVLNNTEDVTVQFCELGPALYQSDIDSSPNGYGPNVTTIGSAPSPGSTYTKRVTFYQNLVWGNKQRSMRSHGTDGFEVVNCAYGNWGNDLFHGNPRGANIVGNMFKKGPETSGNQIARTETNASYPSVFSNSVYFPMSGAMANIGIGFSPTLNLNSGAVRTSLYGGALHNVTCDTASAALFAQVVGAAGPSTVDSISTTIKNHALAGTGSFYNGTAYAAPHPSWV